MNSNHIKHEIIGDQAFTENNILIYKLFIYDLPMEATILNITDYFQKFGKVINVRFLGRGKAIIRFADPKGAAKVLQKTCHDFLNSIIHVGACQSWRQPDSQQYIPLPDKNNCNTSNQQNQNALFLTLNDDCLEYICKKLPTTDQINFALTCRRFHHVVVMLSKVKHANLNSNFFNKWTLLKIRVFLQIVGPQIKTVEIDHLSNEAQLELYGSFCTNVEKLKVNLNLNIKSKSLQKLIEKMQKLQELELINVEMNADFIKYLENFKNLKNLNIMCSDDVTGENIHLLCGLEKLSLNGYPKLTSWHFRDICKNLTNLHYLEINNCSLLKTEDYEHISEHLLKLQTLKLSSLKENYNCLAQLPKLKQLEMIGCDVKVELLKNLVKFHANQLQELSVQSCDKCLEKAYLVAEFKNLKFLHFDSNVLNDEILVILSQLTGLEQIKLGVCYYITNCAIIKLLENCLKLQRLDLCRCDSLTPALVGDAIKLLKEQKDNFLRTDCVTVTGTCTILSPRVARAFYPINVCADVFKIFLIEDNGGMCDYEDSDDSGD